MRLSDRLHTFIERYNILKQPTEAIASHLAQAPTLSKVDVLAMHFFRTASMIALHACAPFSLPVNLALGFVGSLVYRLTIEVKCIYKMALPSFAGAFAYSLSKEALIHGAAFSSLSALAKALLAGASLTAYFVYVILTVDYDVDHPLPKSCCSS